MSAWNNTSPEERLRMWKVFREELKGEADEDLLNKTAIFFANVPVGSRTVDFYTPSSWPTPWEILYHNLFCINSISLLICHTLWLTMEKDRVEIALVEDERDRFLVPLIDKKYILNYVLGEISTIEAFPRMKIIEVFRSDEIAYLR